MGVAANRDEMEHRLVLRPSVIEDSIAKEHTRQLRVRTAAHHDQLETDTAMTSAP